MAYTVESNLGLPPITQTDTVQMTDLGRKTAAKDPTYGYGEFVYVKATAAIAVGQPVLFDTYGATGILAVTTSRGLIGIAMAAIASGSYGWVQVLGNAVVKAGTVVANTAVYATAVAGTLDDAVSATNKLDNAIFKTADGTPAAGFAVAQIEYPSMTGNG